MEAVGSGPWAWGLRVQGLGLRDQDLRFRVSGLISGLRFRIQGSMCRT